MKLGIKLLLSTLTGTIFLFSYTSASANNSGQAGYNTSKNYNISTNANLGGPYSSFVNISKSRLILDGSSTASHYFRVGETQYRRGELEKAERSFNAVLRANGLDKQAHYYLAKINKEQGDIDEAVKHVLAMHKMK